jgi:hypothetical protein
MPTIPILRRQEDCEFEVSLIYRVRPCLKIRKRKRRKEGKKEKKEEEREGGREEGRKEIHIPLKGVAY